MKLLSNLRADFADYYRTSLADFYVSPAHRWLVYAITFICAGLGAFGALAIYDISNNLVSVPLTFKGMYAWHTAANFALILLGIDFTVASLIAPWGGYHRRTVAKTWGVFLSTYLLGYISQRTVVYRLMALYSPELLWVFSINPSQRPDSLSSFVLLLPLVLVIAYAIMRMILSMQARSEELLRVRIDTILEERAGKADRCAKAEQRAEASDEYLSLPADQGVGPIRPSQVTHITVEDHYLRIYYQVESRLTDTLIRMPLKELFARLPSDQFVQIHRSHIVHLRWISGVKRDGRKIRLKMKHGDFDLPVSRYRLPQLLPVLEKFLVPHAAGSL